MPSLPHFPAAAIYALAVLAANLTATLFVPFPVFGQVAVGTFLFGITFSQRDRLHQSGGRRLVYWVILGTAVLNFLVMLSFLHLWGGPAVGAARWVGWEWLAQGLAMLRESTFRVLLASFSAIVLAEAADTEVYHQLRRRSWVVRVLRSNLLSIPLDSLLFNLVAFAGIFPWAMLLSIVFGEVVIKFLVSLAYGWHIRPHRTS